MSLATRRLGATDKEPLTLEVSSELLSASGLLFHLEGLQGLTVIAKKSWALTDDFEAYFTYKARLFVVASPFARVEISLIGQPPDELVFSEVEAQVRGYRPRPVLELRAVARYFWLPFNPPRRLVQEHESRTGQT